jgi:hypothetical protein
MARQADGKVLMNLRGTLIVGILTFAVAGLAPLLGQAQEKTPSLGNLAKELRAERAASKKSVRVFTNDNLPHRPGGGGISVAGTMSPEPTEQPAGGGTASAQAAGASSEESSGAHDEEYYRKQMAALQSQLELHQRELRVLQQKQAQGQMQYYPDPNKTLQQEFSRSDINKRNDQIAKKQAQIDEDNSAIQDLRDQLRREGGPPGWLR